MHKLPSVLQNKKVGTLETEVEVDLSTSAEKLKEGSSTTSSDNMFKIRPKKKMLKPNATYLCLTVVCIISAVSAVGTLWNIMDTGRQTESFKSRFDAIDKELSLIAKVSSKPRLGATLTSASNGETLPNPPTTSRTKKTTEPTKAKVASKSGFDAGITASSKGATLRNPLTTSRTKTTKKITTDTTTVATATATSDSFSLPFAFEVLQSKNITFGGYEFLALQLQLPKDGLSQSENWCRDYQYLCEHFFRRPTGCAERKGSSLAPIYTKCKTEYNSDMSIGLYKVLGCNPSYKIANATNTAFPSEETPAAYGYNAFGFHKCDPEFCNKTINDSELSLTYMKGSWNDNFTKPIYTVCL